jgi:peptidoglycan/LPS O-acetylase OafA/YrhL
MKDNNLDNSRHASAYFPYFDWLRFVLAAMVMLGHDHVFDAVWDSAPTFVAHVFFVLSGWLIGGILLNLSAAGLPRFFFNRALRIWIPYYVACALRIGASLARDTLTADWARVVVYKLAMVCNLFNGDEIVGGFKNAPLHGTGNHFWSVNAEEQSYLAAALLLVCMWRYGGRHWLVWALVTLVTLFVGADYPGLSLGVLAAIVLQRSDWHRTPKGRRVIALVLLHYWLIDRQIKYRRHLWYSPRAGLLLMSSAYAIFVLGLVYGAATLR